jgi:hypothetical protein
MFLTNNPSIIFSFFPSCSFLPFSVFLSHLSFLFFLLFRILFISFSLRLSFIFSFSFFFPSPLFTFVSILRVSFLFYYFLFSFRKLKYWANHCVCLTLFINVSPTLHCGLDFNELYLTALPFLILVRSDAAKPRRNLQY